jgi:hypothetical protein
MMIVRYAIQMKNGNYMKQEFDESLERIRIRVVDNPIDADLLKDKSVALRTINEILTGNTNLLILYDDDNPPESVVELKIDVNIK